MGVVIVVYKTSWLRGGRGDCDVSLYKQAGCAVGVAIVVCHCTKQAGYEAGVVIAMCHSTKQAGCEVGVVIAMCHCTKQAGYEAGVVVAIQLVQRPRVLLT